MSKSKNVIWISPWFRSFSSHNLFLIEKLGFECFIVSSNSHLASDGMLYTNHVLTTKERIARITGKIKFIIEVLKTKHSKRLNKSIFIIDVNDSLFWTFLSLVTSINSERIFVLHNAIDQDNSQQPFLSRRVIRKCLIRRAKRIIVFSQFVKSKTKLQTKAQIDIVPLLPEISIAPFVKNQAKEEKFILAMIGRWSPYKGFEFGIRVFEILRNTLGPKIELHLQLSGLNDDNHQFLIPGIKVLSRESFSWNDLVDNLQSASLILLPYQDASQSGVQVLANALSIPTLVSPVGGLPEYQDPKLPPLELDETLWAKRIIQIIEDINSYRDSCVLHVLNTLEEKVLLKSWSKALNYD